MISQTQRVLVTGARGFIGSSLSTRLKTLGNHEVIELDLPENDIASALLEFTNVTHVFHLAARNFVPDSYKYPADFFRVNLLGTVNVLEFCRRQKISLTYVSAYVYGRPQSLPIRESDLRSALNPYTESKILSEDLCDFYHRQYDVPITVIRPFNVFGAGQREEFLIPTIIRQALDSAVSTIEVSDLRPKRDFVYIEDLIDALVLTIGRPKYSVFNIAGGVSYSVRSIIEIILKAAKMSKPFRSLEKFRDDEILDLYADISFAKSELGWTPKVSFEEGIAKILRASHL